ncbi:MAG TPA: ribose-phosphate diphosphokinase [Candidatus Diapherotrites archaeon]|uniref:ribose-phosphate diphosphokinase n=1 Tax=Candidatus Iainarchaeum sp. TaxID=3101447 RepID=A0A7J4IW78_9ARCH|nr:ribose-phosphate diphosphokinase [Candidatus Diapherotrites archaeon]
MIIFPLTNGAKIAQGIAKASDFRLGKIAISRFPDGELHLDFEDDIHGRKVVLVQTMHPNPNESIIELVFAARTAKELGATKVIGVVPYLAYMRQDKRFHAGECVSNHIMASLLNASLDKIITVDPHLHRVHNLADLFHIERKKLSANNAIAAYIRSKFPEANSVVVGPDIESSQWAKTIADSIGFRSAIFLKERLSSRKVRINVTTELEWKGKSVIIVDDIISSGHTMIEAVREIRKRRPKAVHAICVHAIFAEGAFEKIRKAGAKTIVSTDCIEHTSNAIELEPLIAKELY